MSQDLAPAVRTPREDDERLRVRIAWAYFIQGLTQGEIARSFDLNRVRVNRIIAAMRDDGTVQIFINSPALPFVKLERQLEEVFGLKQVVIAPCMPDQSGPTAVVAAAAGTLISDRLAQNGTVGIGWGRTLRLSLRSIRRRSIANLTVVALIGGLTRTTLTNAYETAMHLADLCQADCSYIPAPVYMNDRPTRDLLLRQDMIAAVIERATQADLALVSVGSMSSSATMLQLGLIDEGDIRSLQRAGAVGDILGQFIDAEGALVEHPLNDRVMAVSPLALREIPEVILASGGAEKDACLLGALRGGYANVLVTDDATGQRLLAAAQG